MLGYRIPRSRSKQEIAPFDHPSLGASRIGLYVQRRKGGKQRSVMRPGDLSEDDLPFSFDCLRRKT